MKKAILSLCLALPLLTACVSEDSQYGTGTNSITISGIESKYNAVSYAGYSLKITPTVTTNFSDDDLEYTWSYFDPNVNTYNKDIKATIVSHDRNLDMPVNISDGQYTFYYTVTSKSTGLSKQSEKFTVNVASALSKGFYICKENAEGNTDLDLYSTSENKLIENVLSERNGSTLKGKPQSMDFVSGLPYLDPDTETGTYGNSLCITTQSGDARWVRLSDLKTVKNTDNCHYEKVEGEMPFRTVRGYWTIYYLTNNAVYHAYSGNMGGIGVLGAYEGYGGSNHVISSPNSFYCIAYWDAPNQSLGFIDYNGSYMEPTSQATGYSTMRTGCDCITSGMCRAGGSEIGYFLLQNPQGQRMLYFVSISMSNATLNDVRAVDADSHLGRARLFAVNGLQATLLYCVDGNDLYAYDLSGNNAERKLTLQGIPASEEITYVANRYCTLNDDSFDYLIVGTQTGNQYKVYMYEMIGGEPVGDPVRTISGTGKLRKVDYANPNIVDSQGYTPILDD